MAKKVLKHFVTIVLYAIAVGLAAPVLNLENIWAAYKSPIHWIGAFVAAAVVYGIVYYFQKINPRKTYYCINVITATIIITVLVLAFMAGLVWISLIEKTTIKIILLIAFFVVCLFLVYAFIYRGVAVYKKGKIRVFKLTVKTYKTSKIDSVRFEYIGKKCLIHIIVCGNDHVFKTQSSVGKRCEERFKQM